MKLAAPRLVAALGLAACAAPRPPPPATHVSPAAPATPGATVAVRADAGIASAELAWLVAHIADDPDPAHAGDSDAVRRLVNNGPDGVRVVAEVLRRGDRRRTPYARRVLERVALQRCDRDLARASTLALWLQRGVTAGGAPDAGFTWSGGDDTPWARDAVERVRRWADARLPCHAVEAPGDGGTP